MRTQTVTLAQAQQLIEQFVREMKAQRSAAQTDAVHGNSVHDDAAHDGDRSAQAPHSRALRISGSPLSGKSSLAFAAFSATWNHEAIRNGKAYLLVSSKAAADQLNTPVINAVQHAQEGRPVRTIGSLAFSILSQERAAKGEPLPHFVDDAERGQAVQQVLETHRSHMLAGDDCETCDLLRAYLSVKNDSRGRSGLDRESEQEQNTSSDQLLLEVMTPAFIDQLIHLFDMFNGLGVASDSQHFDAILHDPAVDERMVEEWQLGRRLQHEAQQVLASQAPGLFLADFSAVLALVTQALSEDSSVLRVPEVVIMDDCQDLTVAGYSFLEQLALHGCAVILIGNDDQATRTYRGAFPEALSALEEAGLHAQHYELAEQLDQREKFDHLNQVDHVDQLDYRDQRDQKEDGEELSYRAQVATRVSLALTSSLVSTDVALPLRPGKLRAAQQAFMNEPRPIMPDHTLQGRLLRSNSELLDDLVWQVTTSVMNNDDLNWSDCAIIAHTNSVLQQVGERLEEEGIPVRYSSVSQLLKDSPIVQGLLAIIRLNALIVRKDLSDISLYTKLVTQVITSPLFPVVTTVDGVSQYRTVHEERIFTIFQTIAYLSQVEEVKDTFEALIQDWQELSGNTEPLNAEAIVVLLLMGSERSQAHIWSMYDSIARTTSSKANTPVATPAMDGETEQTSEGVVTSETMHVREDTQLLDTEHSVETEHTEASPDEQDNEQATSRQHSDEDSLDQYLNAIRAKKGPSHTDEEALIRAITIVQTLKTTADEDELISQPSIALWNAWTACQISDFWREEALSSGKRAAQANNYLDTIVRLFRRAETREKEESAEEFAEWIESLEVEAGSLAQVAPRPDSVVLASPDSANTQHFKKVWIVGVQDGQWPNWEAPDTLLSGQAFSTVAISHILTEQGIELNRGSLDASTQLMHTQDQYIADFELRAFLVAVTRASEETVICAVWDEDQAPSEYLTTFMPEVFCETGIRTADNDSNRHYTPTGFNPGQEESSLFAGFDTSVDGLAIAAKTVLVGSLAQQTHTGDTDPAVLDDALSALKILRGMTSQATQLTTGFVKPQADTDDQDGFRQTRPASGKGSLSPSAVDAIWACPLRWSLQERFAGPRRSSEDMTFGTIIHNCAQWATDNGYDRSMAQDELFSALRQHYSQLREQSHYTASTSEELFKQQSNDHEVEEVLHNIATYFVESRDATYAPVGKRGEEKPAGRLTGSAAEVSVNIPLSLSGILPFVRNLSGLHNTTKAELYSALSCLAGGFADEEPHDLRTYMSARVDRVERREDADGFTHWNIIDWKTGKHPNKSFEDLQLICYQLGLAFSPALQEVNKSIHQRATDQSLPDDEVKQKHRMPDIERSMLFYPRKQNGPAESYRVENGYQPQLFQGDKLYEEYSPRVYYPHLAKFFTPDKNVLRLAQADNMSDIAQWLFTKANALLVSGNSDSSKKSSHNEQTDPMENSALWALTMLARVFYAVSYSQADYFPAKKSPAACGTCAFKPVCPLYSHESQTVFGPLVGMNIHEVREQVKRRRQ